MTNYGKIAKDAAARKRELQTELAAAKRTVAGCEKELAVLDQILGALKGAAPAAVRRGAGRKAGGRKAAGKGRRATKKRGKWRPGKPGRPPQWYIDQQKAAGGAKPGRKAGKRAARKAGGRKPGRKPGRRAAAAPSPAPEATAAAPNE